VLWNYGEGGNFLRRMDGGQCAWSKRDQGLGRSLALPGGGFALAMVDVEAFGGAGCRVWGLALVSGLETSKAVEDSRETRGHAARWTRAERSQRDRFHHVFSWGACTR
jgi:hypothetical protein